MSKDGLAIKRMPFFVCHARSAVFCFYDFVLFTKGLSGFFASPYILNNNEVTLMSFITSLFLKISLVLSLLTLYSGTDVSISLIVAQLIAILTLDTFFDNSTSGIIIVQNLKEYLKQRQLNEKTYGAVIYIFCVSTASVMFYIIPSFSAEKITIPDIRGLKPFSAQTNYMSLDGYVMAYCQSHGHDISRGEARKLIKEAMKMQEGGSAGVEVNSKAVSEKNETAAAAEPIAEKKLIAVHPNTQKTFSRSEVMTKYNEIRHPSVENQLNERVYPGKKRVAVIPFENLTENKMAVQRVNQKIEEEFIEKGYEVIEPDRVRAVAADINSLTEEDMQKISQNLNADLVVTGTINRFDHYKKVRLAGLLLGGIVSGVHNYGDVSISTKVFNSAKGKYIYDNSVKEHQKKQVFGMFQGPGGVMNHSLNKTVEKLYNKF